MALNEKLVSKIAISTCAAAMLTLTGCSSSDDDSTAGGGTTTPPAVTYPTTLQGEITSDMTLTLSDSPVLLAGNKVKVKNGATLTIEPGVKLCGESQAYLIVTKGAKIMAEGTEASPVEFTSQAACEGAPAAAGQWGGVTLLGNAVTNEADEIRYEVDESDADFAYGGDDDADNSGVLNHVKILNSGYAVAVDKEVNGLSLCGIGSATVVDNITIVDSGDDGIEIWGGSVELNHISITGAQDDGFDVDSGYHGAVTDLTVTQTEPGASLVEMTNGGDASKQRTDWSLDGFTLTASVNQKKEGGLYFKDLDVTGSFKNGMIDMSASPALNTGAGLTNKEGVFMSPVFENVTVKGSESVDLQANRRDGETTDAGTIELNGAFASGTANSYISYP